MKRARRPLNKEISQKGFTKKGAGVYTDSCNEGAPAPGERKVFGMPKVDPEFLKQVRAWIEAHKEEMVEEIRRFVQVPSVSRADLAEEGKPFGPDCDKMLNFALKRGEEMGFHSVNHDHYCGSICMGPIENSIAIIGHLDVVPPGDGWIYPCYDLTRLNEDWVVGRGCSDNKGPAVMGLFAMKMLRDLKVELKHGIRVICGLSEETGMQDLSHYIAHDPVQPVVALVPDAGFPLNYAQKGTLGAHISIDLGSLKVLKDFEGGLVDNMVPAHAQAHLAVSAEEAKAALQKAGFVDERITVRPDGENGCVMEAAGLAAHAASPDKGVSAFNLLSGALLKSGLLDEGAQRAMRSVEEMSRDYFGETSGIGCEDPDSGKTTMNLGVAYTKAGRLTLHVDCRLSVASDLTQTEKGFREKCAQRGFEIDTISLGKPFYIDKKDPRAVALMDVYSQVTGRNDEPYSMGGGTYSRVMPCAITYGPGLPEDLPEPPVKLPEGHGGGHQPDELNYLPNLFLALEVYAAALVELDKIV